MSAPTTISGTTISGSLIAKNEDEAHKKVADIVAAYAPNRPQAGTPARISIKAYPVMVAQLGGPSTVSHFDVEYEVVL